MQLLTFSKVRSQSVSINTTGNIADTSAILDITSVSKGILIPRMSQTQRLAIPLPAEGLLVYQTDGTKGFYFYNAVTGWSMLALGGVGINSLNGLTAATQSFATGTAGTAPNWSSLNTTHTLNIPLASTSGVTAGLLSNADLNAFKNFAATGAWLTTGNAGTNPATSFLGSTDNRSLRFRTANVQRMIVDSVGNVAVGTDTFDVANPERFLINAGNTSSVTGLLTKGRINNYFQMNIKNLSSGASAATDIVATADNGTETSNYVDLGINGSGYTGSAIETGKANDGYLISSGNDFYVVNSSANKSLLFLTGGTGLANERMRILANGRVGMGVQDPTSQFVVKDTVEIRRTGPLSQLLFTNTGGTGDFRIGGDGGDLYWQGGGGRSLQMGSYWTTILGGDRQTPSYPAFVSGLSGTGVLVQSQRDGSVPLGIQANSANQSANLTEWRSSTGSILGAVNRTGYMGLGTSNPATALHITGTNPLTLEGVALGTSTSGDSLLTITSGLVRKLPVSAFAASSNTWSTTGNSGTNYSANFLGTTDNSSLRLRANNIQGLMIDSLGNVAIGASPTLTSGTFREKFLIDAGTTTSYSPLVVQGSIDNYFQFNIQNLSSGSKASSDVVATSNTGTETTNYVDMGINSATNTSNFFGNANDAYLYNQGQNLLIGTSTADKDLIFITGGSTQSSGLIQNNERMRIDGTTGYVGMGINSPEQKLHVVLTTGAVTPPADVATIETKNTTTTTYSGPPQLNLVRQIPSTSYSSSGSWAGPVISFAHRNPGSNASAAVQLQSITNPSSSKLSFLTRTGMSNANPSTGSLAENMSLNGNVLNVTSLTGSSTTGLSADANGNIIRTASDQRLKQNIVTIDSALDKVLRLRGVNFNWKDGAKYGSNTEIGLIAQEVEKVVPEVVSNGNEYKSVNYQVLTALLIEAIKVQQDAILKLKQEVNDQNVRIEKLEEKFK